jgi:hypothetical protein
MRNPTTAFDEAVTDAVDTLPGDPGAKSATLLWLAAEIACDVCGVEPHPDTVSEIAKLCALTMRSYIDVKRGER